MQGQAYKGGLALLSALLYCTHSPTADAATIIAAIVIAAAGGSTGALS